MKLNKVQTQTRLSQAWGQPAYVIGYYLHGNRTTYAATDHADHWLPLTTSWEMGVQQFEPSGMDWPSPNQKVWAEAVSKAAALARDHFVEQRNIDAIRRLPRAQVIAEAQNWQRLGDEHDTWLMPSASGRGSVYRVNDTCTCPDFECNRVMGGWCKHRLARALARRAEKFLLEGQAVASDCPTTASAAIHPDSADSTPSISPQAQRIDLIVAYEATDAPVLPLINANGLLVEFKADGQVVPPPTRTISDLYRWLQGNEYVPEGFKWLGWERGLRHRRQTYTLGWVGKGQHPSSVV